MSQIVWQSYIVIALIVLSAILVTFMLIYRHRHKTNIETGMLLKQMRITNRMRALLDAQRSYIDEIERFKKNVSEEWEGTRQFVMERSGIDIGDMRQPPHPSVDFNRLLADIDKG